MTDHQLLMILTGGFVGWALGSVLSPVVRLLWDIKQHGWRNDR